MADLRQSLAELETVEARLTKAQGQVSRLTRRKGEIMQEIAAEKAALADASAKADAILAKG
jgi:chromosome segregation ATPase